MSATWLIEHGDCVEIMAQMPEASVDAVVCDPPYDLTSARPSGRSAATEGAVMRGFMGLAWDGSGIAFQPETWAAALRVLKPGGHLLAFGGTRTHHRLYCAVEDAGFEIRDTVLWLYGSGFPKSKNMGDGWGTALKPAFEPIVLARKPLSEKNVAANVQRWGTGVLNVDGCRIPAEEGASLDGGRVSSTSDGWDRPWKHDKEAVQASRDRGRDAVARAEGIGRWPVNLALDEEAASLLDEQSGERPAGEAIRHRSGGRTFGGEKAKPPLADLGYGDTGGASRFFYTAKASRSEREAGLDGIEKRPGGSTAKGYTEDIARGQDRNRPTRNDHPTVKPVDLMQWLCRLVTPPGGLVLDPFCGSGSTGIAALREGFRFVGIEKDERYCAIARRRIEEDAPLFHRSAQ